MLLCYFATCYLKLETLLTLLPTRYVSDSYTILIAVFALLRLPLSGIHHQMHVHRHACFELQSQRRLGIVARRLGEKRVDAIIVENRNPLLKAITDEFETASQVLTSDKP